MIYIAITAITMILCVFLYRILSVHGKDIFSPFYLSTVLYAIVFVFGPMYYLNRGLTKVEGIEVMSYLPEATLVFICGYFALFMGSFLGSHTKAVAVFPSYESDAHYSHISPKAQRLIVRTAWFFYWIGIIMSMVYYMSTGRSLLMMLTFGRIKSGLTITSLQSVAFLVYFLDFPISALLILFLFANNIKAKMALAIYFIITTTAGFRYLPMILVLAYLTLSFLKNNKRPKLFFVMISILGAYLFVGIVGVYRTAIKTGGLIDLSLLNRETIRGGFLSNSDIFYPFYCLVHAFNNGSVSCHYGQGVLYIFTMAIPRFLWPNKPTSIGLTAFEAMWGNSMGGAAYPAIGEFYYEFGFWGMLLCMFITGYWFEEKFKTAVVNRRSTIDLIKYSLLFAYLLQFINRGYFAGWFYDLVFIMFPIWILQARLRKKGIIV